MKRLLISIMILIAPGVQAQIVNIESQRLQSDTTGWLGTFGAGFKLDKNKVTLLNLSATGQIEYKAPRSLYLFLVNYELLHGASQTLQDNLFFHLRYNYKVNNLLRWEAFTQMQNNNLAGIKNRWLMGTGPRFKISKTKKLALYAATLAMYEDEKILPEPVVHHQRMRSSSYATMTWRPVEKSEIVSTVFFQPLFTDFSDARLLHELKLTFNFTKNFSFNTVWSFQYDTRPPMDVPKSIYSLHNGIEYKF